MKTSTSTPYWLIILTAICINTGLKAQVFINEYSCANLKSFMDNNSKYEDWIELYNTSSSPVDISGYFLSDDSLSLNKFPIPAGTIIGPNSYKIFWASGRGVAAGTNIHTNFKLTQTKNTPENILFSSPSSIVIDKIKIKKQNLLIHAVVLPMGLLLGEFSLRLLHSQLTVG